MCNAGVMVEMSRVVKSCEDAMTQRWEHDDTRASTRSAVDYPLAASSARFGCWDGVDDAVARVLVLCLCSCC